MAKSLNYQDPLSFVTSIFKLSQKITEEPYQSNLFRFETCKFRNIIAEKGLSGKLYNRFFFYGMCHECLIVPEQLDSQLKGCARCHLVYYCSKECQKKDWSSHKDFCKVNAIKPDGKNVFGAAKAEVVNPYDWTKYCNKIMNHNKCTLMRNLKEYEEQMLSFPRVCVVCRESDPAKLTDCKNCYSVSYCSKEHKIQDKKDHNYICAFINMARITYITIKDDGYLSCSLPRDIPEVFKSLQKNIILNKTSKNYNKIYESESGNNYGALMKYDELGCLMTDVISYPLSIIYALENVALKLGKQGQTIDKVQELTVHLVGSRCHKEILGIRKWEYFMHQLPALMKLRILFVGPELWGHGHQNYRHEGKLKGCELCQKKGRKVFYEESQMLYHEYVPTDSYRAPDVIVAFNCGFHTNAGHDNDTWAESLSEMTKDHTVPLIFTSINRYEAEKDLEAVEHASDVEILLNDSGNPYSSQYAMRTLPVHGTSGQKKQDILNFSNAHITVVRALTSSKIF